jgi:hypothetical protein
MLHYLINQDGVMMLPMCREDDTNFIALKGSKIKIGTTRAVYEVNGHPGFVIKESISACNVENETEAELYVTAVMNSFQKVLECIAKVEAISQSGKYLIMEKLDTNIPTNLRSNGRIPEEVADNKLSNFGVAVGNKIKCLDYALLKDNHKAGEISGGVRPANLPTDQYIDEINKDKEFISNILNNP